ncbi:allophanate hydrolase subunit 1 [Aeromicrobium sp.]|uniref:5-oxoprolinase subunit B family protein n=1 Tax=Aeromicrobium sp. TaxID=1871063 RepID=UPI0019A24B11|nr:allophanate hydrolase subunit 1 [Aeromicrobium sp.]MBC7633747.1 allophanate hydrolase subunit 1 [Aeromicrobium sp.]
MRTLPYGDAAMLLDCESLDEAQRWFAALHPQVDSVLGARSVLLRGDPRSLRALVAATTPGSSAAIDQVAELEVPVVYDGPDLADVGRLTGLGEDGVVAAHTGSRWTVAFGGFAPGFSYLVGGDPRLEVPRRPSPRACVPAGSVGLAGEFSGVYPRESPGGWQLLGRTTLTLWDSERADPALLAAGMTVRFVAQR